MHNRRRMRGYQLVVTQWDFARSASAFAEGFLARPVSRIVAVGAAVLGILAGTLTGIVSPGGYLLAAQANRDARTLLNQGLVFYEEGNFDAACAAFEQALAQDPSNDLISDFVDAVTVAKIYRMVREADPRVSGLGRYFLSRARAAVVAKISDPKAIQTAIQDVLTSDQEERIIKVIKHTATFGRNLVPQLVPLLKDSDLSRRTIAFNWIVRVGIDAVPILQAARKHPDRVIRRSVAELLGTRDLRHVVSLATLKAMIQTDEAAEVREAAEKSFRAILSDLDNQGRELTAEEYFLKNAYEQYYLQPYRNPFASTYYQPTIYTLQGEEIVGERVADFQLSDRMAQQALEEALELNPDFEPARVLLLCNDAAQIVEYDLNVAYYSRPEAQGDIRPILEKQKSYFDYVIRNRLLAPPKILFEGLMQALEDGKPEVARKIIETIQETSPRGRVPEALLRALEDSNSRLVRTAAAIALAYWREPTGFDAGQQVVAVLADAVFSSGIYTIQKVMGDTKRANRFDALFRELNCESFSPLPSVEAGYEAVIASPPDAVFVDEAVKLSVEKPGVAPINFFVNELRKNYRSANVPVIVVVPDSRFDAADKLYTSEPRKVWTIKESVDRLYLERVLFPKLFKDRNDAKALATRLAVEAGKALEHLSSIPTNMPVATAVPTLIKVLRNRPDEVRLPVIRALGNLGAIEAANELALVFSREENVHGIRLEAMRALGMVLAGTPEPAADLVLKAITTGLGDSDLELRRASWFAFSNAKAPGKLQYQFLVAPPPTEPTAKGAPEEVGEGPSEKPEETPSEEESSESSETEEEQ